MARIKYSGLIDEINGSIGGTTFQRNRYGFTIKRKPSGTTSATSSQSIRRLSLYRVQQNWIALSNADHDNWNTYASTFPSPTRLNPASFLNGVNLYEKYHLLRAVGITSILNDPNGAQQTLSFDGFELDSSGGTMTMESNITVSGANWLFLIFLSRPVSSTSTLSKSKTRFISQSTVSGFLSKEIQNEYINIFGFIPVRNDFIQFRRVLLNFDNGQIFDEGVRLVQVLEI
jgi:hypothetical protein